MREVVGSIIGAIVIVVIIALIYSFFFRGNGKGDGLEAANNQAEKRYEEIEDNKDSNVKPSRATEDTVIEEQEDLLPDNIIVEIIEDEVTINGQSVANPEELKDKINEYNSDTRSFELVETRSILSTYEWVAKTFDELEIYLKEE